MTSRTEQQAGFTLIEVLVVLVILGLVGGLVLSHGPARPAGLDLRSEASQMMQALRGARGQAIATNHDVAFVLDLPQHGWRIDRGPLHPLSPPVRATMTAVAGDAPPATILFAPDGSASGGVIALAEGASTMRVAVDWLTGRVGLLDAP